MKKFRKAVEGHEVTIEVKPDQLAYVGYTRCPFEGCVMHVEGGLRIFYEGDDEQQALAGTEKKLAKHMEDCDKQPKK